MPHICADPRVQTVRLFDPTTGETKMEFRGHDNDVEVVVFAPITAYGPIRELAGIPVCHLACTRSSKLIDLVLEH